MWPKRLAVMAALLLPVLFAADDLNFAEVDPYSVLEGVDGVPPDIHNVDWKQESLKCPAQQVVTIDGQCVDCPAGKVSAEGEWWCHD